MLTSIFRNTPSDRNDEQRSRLESLLAIACDGSAEDCYDEPGGEVPPTQPNPSGGRKPDPETQAKPDEPVVQTVVNRLAEALFSLAQGLASPAPVAA